MKITIDLQPDLSAALDAAVAGQLDQTRETLIVLALRD